MLFRIERKEGMPLFVEADEFKLEDDSIEALLAAGAELEARDDEGWRPLHRAAAGAENPAVIDTLLAAGARTRRAA